jgi:hypothetical protein
MTSDKKAIKIKYPVFNALEENPYQEEMNKLIDISLSEANTTRTQKNIAECLAKSIKSKYGVKDKEELKQKVEDILSLHGLSQKHFDPLSTISTLTFGNLQTVNDISVDDNANKTLLSVRIISFIYLDVILIDFSFSSITSVRSSVNPIFSATLIRAFSVRDPTPRE